MPAPPSAIDFGRVARGSAKEGIALSKRAEIGPKFRLEASRDVLALGTRLLRGLLRPPRPLVTHLALPNHSGQRVT